MKVVLDTNVLVSGLLSPQGPPGIILDALAAGDLALYLDERILAEYREVLARRRLKIPDAAAASLLSAVADKGHRVSAPRTQAQLPDPKDKMFLEVALACQADYLVTGNLKDFPADKTKGVTVVSPREFLDRREQGGARSP